MLACPHPVTGNSINANRARMVRMPICLSLLARFGGIINQSGWVTNLFVVRPLGGSSYSSWNLPVEYKLPPKGPNYEPHIVYAGKSSGRSVAAVRSLKRDLLDPRLAEVAHSSRKYRGHPGLLRSSECSFVLGVVDRL